MQARLTREADIRRAWQSLNRAAQPNYDRLLPAMRGDIAKRIWLIAPPPDETEFKRGMPFCNDAALQMHQLLLTEAGLNTDKDVLVVPCSWMGTKPTRRSFLAARDFITRCALKNYIDAFIAVGALAFRQSFGDGLAGSPFTAGGIVYPRHLAGKGAGIPVLSLPDPAPLIVVAPPRTRDFYIQKNLAETWTRNFFKLLPSVERLSHEKTDRG